MIGDTAVCVHPTDERYTDLVGKMVRIPLNGREIPIVADALLAKKELGTGAVKVTPAHDPNDYACALRNDLPMINILNPDCTINEEGGDYEGLPYEEARKKVVEAMEAAGHYHGVEDRVIPTPHSDRSKHVIQPYLSDQWFVKMDELAQSAIDAVDDKRVKFFPNRYENTYRNWLAEKRDWCISRQLWWGHRIPIWSKPMLASGHPYLNHLFEFDGEPVEEGVPFELKGDAAGKACAVIADGVEPGSKVMLVCVDAGNEGIEKELEADGFEQDPDVLDTWFSSALWPHATLGWPDTETNPPIADSKVQSPNSKVSNGNEVLDYFYPGSVLITSRDIITLWVARMVLAGLYNMGDIPFSHVCIHPKILDGFGQTMSKSKGNGCDPMDLIDKYGTDAVRFTIASFAGETQDVRLPMAYECPHCQEEIPQALDGMGVKPRSVKGSLRGTSEAVLMPCPKCKKESQFSTPQYTPDPTQPVARMVSERFDYGRNFCNKLWNASRFAMMNLEGYTPGPVADEELRLEDRWILSRLSTMAEEVNTFLGRYQLDAATRAIRDFAWNEFCDWYLEMIKPRMRDDALRPAAQRVLVGVLDNLLRLLHPFAPFITEELWSRLAELAPKRGLLEPKDAEEAVMIAAWPEPPKAWQDAGLEKRFETLQELIVSVRNIRAHYKISPKAPLKLYLECAEDVAADVQSVESQFDNLAKIALEAAGASIEQPKLAASFSMGDVNGYISLEGVIDAGAEVDRLKKELEKKLKHKMGTEKKLSNERFVSSAPADVVEGVRETLATVTREIESIEKMITDLGGE